MRIIAGKIKYIFVTSLLRVPWIAFSISAIRFIFFKYLLRRKLLMWSVDENLTKLYEYSKSAYSKALIRPLTRSVLPIQLASSLLWPEPFDKRILIIGPRYESDYFIARGYGFSKPNITLIDHFSYSKIISVGDAHQLDFADEYFDVVIASWILVYSLDHAQLLSEIRRVLKPNTGIAIVTGDQQDVVQTSNTDTSFGYKFDAEHIKAQWPIKEDEVVVSWPTKSVVALGVPQVIVAIQKTTE